MGSVGPDDDGSIETPFIPQQTATTEELQTRVKLTTEAGVRPFSNIIDVMESDERLEFVIKDLLPKSGMVYFGGLSGTGKTILAMQVAANLVLGRPTMTWMLGEYAEDSTVMMLSLEMNKVELQGRAEHMFKSFPAEDQKILKERFLTYTEPEPYELWNPAHVLDLTRMIKSSGANVLLIDSASVSFAPSLKDDEKVNESIKHLYMLRSRLGVSMMVVAHTRKPPAGIASNPEDVTINELFGHSGVAQSASSIIIMVEDETQRKMIAKKSKEGDNSIALETEKLVHIINAKSRFSVNGGVFKAWLSSKNNVDKGEPLMFKRNAIPIAPTEEARRQMNAKVSSNLPLMGDVDFGSVLGDDDE